MTIFIGIAVAFLLVSLLFGERVAAFVLNSVAAITMAGITWFIAGMATGHGSIELFLGAFICWLAVFYAFRGGMKSAMSR